MTEEKKPKLDWPENRVLILLHIDDDAGWIGRTLGEEWLSTDSRKDYLNFPLLDDPYMMWIHGLSSVLMKLTGAESCTTEWLDADTSGQQRTLVALPHGGAVTPNRRMSIAHMRISQAHKESDTFFAIGVPDGVEVVTIQDLGVELFLEAMIEMHFAYMDKARKAAKTAIEALSGRNI